MNSNLQQPEMKLGIIIPPKCQQLPPPCLNNLLLFYIFITLLHALVCSCCILCLLCPLTMTLWHRVTVNEVCNCNCLILWDFLPILFIHILVKNADLKSNFPEAMSYIYNVRFHWTPCCCHKNCSFSSCFLFTVKTAFSANAFLYLALTQITTPLP